MKIPTQKEIEKLCREWQKRLRLQDWVVRIVFTNEFSSFARTHVHPEHKGATIRIRTAFSPFEHACLDFEVTLVHELIHLHTSGFDFPIQDKWRRSENTDERARYEAYEAMVELLAQALVSTKRGRQVPPYVGLQTQF